MITGDSCPSEELPRPSSCARCAQAQREPKHPGVLRGVLGFVIWFGSAGRFDQTAFAAAVHHPELMQSVFLMLIGAVVCFWGIHRIQRGPTRQSLRGYFALFIAKRYLQRAYTHQRRMRRVL